MSSKELTGWYKYLATEPQNSTEIQLALLAQLVMSFMGNKTTLKEMLITQHDFVSKIKEETFSSEDDIAKVFAVLSTNQQS